MSALRLIPLLWRSADRRSHTSTVLAIGAFAVSTALALIVIGGMLGFLERADRQAWRTPIPVAQGETAIASFGVRLVAVAETGATLEEAQPITVMDLHVSDSSARPHAGLRATPTLNLTALAPGDVLVSPALLKDGGAGIQADSPKPFVEVATVGQNRGMLGELDSLRVVGVIPASALDNSNERVMIIGRAGTDPFVTASDVPPLESGDAYHVVSRPASVGGFASTMPDGGGQAGGFSIGLHVMLSRVAAVLLLIPLLTLGGAAARLTVARRDERLATIRLLGGTPGQIATLTAAENAVQGLIGAVVGILGYLALMPLFSQIWFLGGPFQSGDLWVGLGILAATIAIVPAIAACSSLLGLRRVVVSPLGVAQRQPSRGVTILRVVLFFVVLIAWAAMGGGIMALGVIAVLIALAVVFGTINLVGPWLVSLTGRIVTAMAKRPATLIAGRRLQDDPKSAWRSVGGLAMASFVAGFLSIVPALTDVGSERGVMSAVDAMVMSDVSTGALLTLGIAFAVAAASAGITQASLVLDRRRDYSLLYVSGMDLPVLDAVRRRVTLIPLLGSAVGSAALALAFLSPIIGGIFSQLDGSGFLTLALCLAAGVLLVMASSETSRPLLRRVVLAGSPRE